MPRADPLPLGLRPARIFALTGLLALATGAGPAAAAAARIADLPVSFEVRNTNTSGVACPSDGATYTVRGHLVGPRSALRAGQGRVATVYAHGFNLGGETNWHFTGYPGYDHATEMARLGHVSLVYDRLGYDSSDFPDGFSSCMGSTADVAHQLITHLRSGDYRSGRRAPVSFSRVVLAGHDSGGTTVEVEAYSYRDIDGLMVIDYADTGFTPTVTGWSAEAGLVCARGGEEARPGGPGGYFDLGPSDEEVAPLVFINADPRLVDAIVPLRRRNPCGELMSVPAAATTNSGRLGEVEVPVLIAGGDTDVGFSEDGMRRQADLFRGSDDVSVEIFENTGHFPMFERTAPRFRATVSEWLRTRGFVAARARTAHACPAVNPTRSGGPGRDTLIGAAAADNLIGRAGRDRLAGRRGRDCLAAGPGGDRIAAADGRRDLIRCGRGRDLVRADAGDRLRSCERIRRR